MEYIAVYGASSPDIPAEFIAAGRETGRLIARGGFGLICGGGRTGLMAAAIEGCKEAGGKATGVLPRFMVDRGWNHRDLDEMIIAETMHERKRHMLEHARAVIALPGGIGTLEELLEAMTWRQLNLWRGRVAVLNTNGYYEPLAGLLNQSIRLGFMHPDHARLWALASTPAEAVAAATAAPDPTDFSQKIH